MSQVPQPIYTRRLYLEKRSGYYFTLRTFKTLRRMQAYLRETGERSVVNTLAMCRFETPQLRKNGRRDKELGEIVLNLRYLRTNIIAHECAHGAIFWSEHVGLKTFRKRKSNSSNPHEERFCDAVGNLARQITNAHHAYLDTLRIH